MKQNELIQFTSQGIYCPKGDFWIDPRHKVERALITHAHSDHARSGHQSYYCHVNTGQLLTFLFKIKNNIHTFAYGETFYIQGIKITLYPAGHILGSAQILLEYDGLKVVIAGDYKVENDGITTPMQSVPCDIFITESTFAKPHYVWKPQKIIFDQIQSWWQKNQEEGKISILSAYALGKTQRLISNLNVQQGDIHITEKAFHINEIYRQAGCALSDCKVLSRDTIHPGDLVISHSIDTLGLDSSQFSSAAVSGWVADTLFEKMNNGDFALSETLKQKALKNKGFVLSDHADWPGLIQAIEKTGAHKIYVQHGFTRYFSKYLQQQGYDALDTSLISRFIELF